MLFELPKNETPSLTSLPTMAENQARLWHEYEMIISMVPENVKIPVGYHRIMEENKGYTPKIRPSPVAYKRVRLINTRASFCS
jgi:hypothetical protein